jgi:CRP/FNR family transcriptional regulator, cyclic AMP receptor protein
MMIMTTNLLPPWGPLETCAAATRARLEVAATPLSLPGGVPLLTMNEVADGITLLSQGVVRVFHALSEDCQFTVKLLRAPNALGIIEVVHGTRWIASVEALTPVEGVHIPAQVVRRALKEDPGFALAVLEDLAGKFESTIRASRALGFDGCEQRLIRVLLEYAEHFGRPGEEGWVIKYPLSRQRLALEIGAARRSVDRAMATLATEKLLSLSPKGWQVLHAPDMLRRRLESCG